MNKNKIIITAGIDDATKCPCIGSIFVSGVVANRKILAHWKKIGVKDSKLIASKKRFNLAKVIKETALAFSIRQIPPALIDDKRLNLNDWEMLAVLSIVEHLHKKQPFATVYIDNWEVSTKRFSERFKYLMRHIKKPFLAENKINFNKSLVQSINLIAEHRADERYTIVGAASILSKTASDEQYRRYKEEYGNFGSGSPADPQTRLFVFNHRNNPPHIIRKSWNTYKTLVRLDKIEDDPLYIRLKEKRKK